MVNISDPVRRRIALNVVVTVFLIFLGFEVWTTAALNVKWTDVAVIAVLAGCPTWLITIAFTNVTDAQKLKEIVEALGDAVGDARGKKDA